MEDVKLKCLEFFAGIGGFHFSLKEIFHNTEVLAAFDINTVTNAIYRANFPNTRVIQRNIQALSADFLDHFLADLWLLSPPCQPFTRKGVKKDLSDRRCDGLVNLCAQLELMRNPPRYLMLENVCGFEVSDAHNLLCEILARIGYSFEEFILSPLQVGIPNSRPRYYLLAAIDGSAAGPKDKLRSEFPKEIAMDGFRKCCVGEFVEDRVGRTEQILNAATLLKNIAGMGFVANPSKQSACFTKSYSVYLKGCGSILVTSPELQMESPKDEMMRLLDSVEGAFDKEALVSSFGLRFFTWREVANLLGFPKSLRKPEDITNKQMYHALGNSISVYVVSVLLKYLLLNRHVDSLP